MSLFSYFRVCIKKDLSTEYSCKRWVNCPTCTFNSTECEMCPPGRFGSNCAKGDKKIYADLGIIDAGNRKNLYVRKNAANQFCSQPLIVYVFTFFILSLVIFFYNMLQIYS
ncbi:hypothetical protein HNY73_016968 [Argiope bruennichi]|uniref:Uncharacterized protein n=1 Tax=Argiope bruennichi TaxID=94029 RepID=A0A8T0EPF5_ARGBR|nr:hypothetical protein HNY73_016968 [Argiope bruennichi]